LAGSPPIAADCQVDQKRVRLVEGIARLRVAGVGDPPYYASAGMKASSRSPAPAASHDLPFHLHNCLKDKNSTSD